MEQTPMPVRNNNVQVPLDRPVYWYSNGEQHPYEHIAFYNQFMENEPVFRHHINNGQNPYQALLSWALPTALKLSLISTVFVFGCLVYDHIQDTSCIPIPGVTHGTTPNG